MMRCGHSANSMKQIAVDDEIPCCTICDCDEPSFVQPDPTGRKAKCIYCNNTVDSKLGLAFYRYIPNRQYDSYYCGCEGWD